MLTQMLPAPSSTPRSQTSRVSRAGRVGLAVSTTALLAGSTAAVALLDHESTPTVPTASGQAAPGLAPAPVVPAVAAPITDLGGPAPVAAPPPRPAERAVTSARSDGSERAESSGERTSSSGSSRPTVTRDDGDDGDDTGETRAESRAERRAERAEARAEAYEKAREKAERQVRAQVRDWMEERGYGRWADAAGR